MFPNYIISGISSSATSEGKNGLTNRGTLHKIFIERQIVQFEVVLNNVHLAAVQRKYIIHCWGHSNDNSLTMNMNFAFSCINGCLQNKIVY